MNGERYREMISNFFSKMQDLDMHDIQQRSVTCHTAYVTMDLLRGDYGEHFISLSESVNCIYAHVRFN